MRSRVHSGLGRTFLITSFIPCDYSYKPSLQLEAAVIAHPLIYGYRPVCVLSPGITRGMLTSASFPQVPSLVSVVRGKRSLALPQESRYGFTPGFDITHRAVLGRATSRFPKRRDIARHHRAAAGHGFYHRQPKALGIGSLQDQGRIAIKPGYLGLAKPGSMYDLVIETELAREECLLRRQRSSYSNQAKIWKFPRYALKNAQQQIDSFSRNGAAH